MSKSVILNNQEINNKIRRISFQILEYNSNEKEIILAGITKNGFLFAKKIEAILKEITNTKIILCEVVMDKKNPQAIITTSLDVKEYENKSLVLVDDVLNSGSTLIYAIKHFLNVPLKQFKTAVLVNRNHKKFPVKADFKGVSLSTSLQEHITVEFNKQESIAYLE